MPLSKERRVALDKALDELPLPENAVELNYVIAQLCVRYYALKPDAQNYRTINDIAGALHGVPDELYKKITAKYEQTR
jgi:hypothetical protein